MSKAVANVPIVAGNKVIGAIAVENFEREDFFNEGNIRLIQTIAASKGVALESARLFDETRRLLQITEDRAAELAIINSVQEGLASKLDIQGIYDLVGDKLYEIFKPDILFIAIYHPEKNTTSFPYANGRGVVSHELPETELGGFSGEAIHKCQTIIVNEDFERRSAEVDSYNMAGDGVEDPQSVVYVPILAGNSVLGVISLQSFERGYIFPESDIRLLETLTSSRRSRSWPR